MDQDAKNLKLVIYPHSALTSRAKPFDVQDGALADLPSVLAYTDRLKTVLKSMGERGIGLAANQVGLLKRVFVSYADLNKPENPTDLRSYINPVILNEEGDMIPYEEGCLSFPGIRGAVLRRSNVSVGYFDEQGKYIEETANGLQGRCWMHEIDHLNGINIVDKFDQKTLAENKAALGRLKSRG